jgi:hypothetical protein
MDTVKRFLENCGAFAYSEDNPNAGYRYLQPPGRKNQASPPPPSNPRSREHLSLMSLRVAEPLRGG